MIPFLLVALLASPIAPPDISSWFKSLRQPITGISCCDTSDCKSTPARQKADGSWEAMWSEKWVSVPADKIIENEQHPGGQAVLCANPYSGQVYCFTRPGAAG